MGNMPPHYRCYSLFPRCQFVYSGLPCCNWLFQFVSTLNVLPPLSSLLLCPEGWDWGGVERVQTPSSISLLTDSSLCVLAVGSWGKFMNVMIILQINLVVTLYNVMKNVTLWTLGQKVFTLICKNLLLLPLLSQKQWLGRNSSLSCRL